MKKYIDVEQRVIYHHRIAIEVDESQEEDFEEFAVDISKELAYGKYHDIDEVVSEIEKAYEVENVEFIEDGSPNVEFEAE